MEMGKAIFGFFVYSKKIGYHSDIVGNHVPELLQVDLGEDLKSHTAHMTYGWGTRVSLHRV